MTILKHKASRMFAQGVVERGTLDHERGWCKGEHIASASLGPKRVRITNHLAQSTATPVR
ncbi:MAG: hypothetical protein AVDCRST_MAG09-1869 [uncultured Sphingomonas sp.]|uniref:Uncharacterized protein n=1 Tax=uncultured Sphingomonas sp. TaxID=158754 RepID=A0A6J4TB37_9SPHN|nr:MAG: hypothetical protein AVDCRST_MAG09-1869 [uncultured Sphingomonas sp.]